MDPDFSALFHQSSKDHTKGHPPISSDPTTWPLPWKTVYYKAYPRLPKIILPPTTGSADLFATVSKRTSRRDFDAQATLTLAEVSRLLQYTCGTTELAADGKSMRRAQASGGARFPLEVYPLIVRGSAELASGLYHYNVKAHALDVLWERTFSDEAMDAMFTHAWTKQASMVLLVTANFQRNQMKYGERGYRYILIEAGHIGQNGYLIAEALGLKCCALGGTKDEAIERVLDIDGVGESLVYALALGR